jgi:hypothetical protein
MIRKTIAQRVNLPKHPSITGYSSFRFYLITVNSSWLGNVTTNAHLNSSILDRLIIIQRNTLEIRLYLLDLLQNQLQRKPCRSVYPYNLSKQKAKPMPNECLLWRVRAVTSSREGAVSKVIFGNFSPHSELKINTKNSYPVPLLKWYGIFFARFLG